LQRAVPGCAVTLAAETAKQTGFQVELFPKAGHLFALEYPQKAAISLVLSFLQSSATTLEEAEKQSAVKE